MGWDRVRLEQHSGGPFPVTITLEVECGMDETYTWLDIQPEAPRAE